MLEELLASVRAKQGVLPPGQPEPALRLVLDQRGVGLAIDQPAPRDQTIDHHGKPVLLIDDQVSQVLDGTIINTVETDEGTRLSIEKAGSE